MTSMHTDRILLQELTNDGQSVFLHYDAMTGLYMAFGYSAYYADMAASPILAYSDEMQMPVAILRRKDVLDIRQSMTLVNHIPRESYHFHTKQPIGDAGYERWANRCKMEEG